MINFTEEEKEFKKILDHFTGELKTVRTGRSHSSLVENIMVDSYGSQIPLSHVSAISTPDARSIVVKPWDKSTLPNIESAIKKENLGLGMIAESGQIRLTIPPLTEDRRKEFVKLIGKKMEESKITLRKRRDDIRKTILDEERAKTISEDQKFSQNEKMEKMTEEFNKKIEEFAAKKEKELMEV
ncbi:ribosome recycling factor [Candidatus Giovannonibacteria bacterium RIFCSPHIGHO2_01_FULL_45_33]|uniref:Ribosome-recycling factor n=1 Tax=Candidatus Giovannonibacteria bacterium RIFCSPLOWO2_01_FULL_45_34 TaxID=1798351 RepID=A0A1F5WZF7_9BACT|nr:MAG: ribosome recycling factor [Candidatus Giovannonibacteria bacterium RIFCSPHIGHO2_01_FULL_45_33]OGF69237.1 MAG: ribosome recycling factor [Candidatus Giovannonibacteria bacterium RIFCSPHIGHO2_02_FULL_44_11]OGF81024.1 MAG: ribosome recycling factor [Candidatus Giovannonibacteria bacterium RIFCSPLOWO2_01_FULL_45_34]